MIGTHNWIKVGIDVDSEMNLICVVLNRTITDNHPDYTTVNISSFTFLLIIV